MAKTVTITDTSGTTIETTVSNDDTARQYESLPFETDHIVIVTVTDDGRPSMGWISSR